MIYFRGCVVRDKLSSISDATETILKQARMDYTILEDETMLWILPNENRI